MKVDAEKCIGCSLCASMFPNTFGMKDNKAYIKNDDEVEVSCPVDAIEHECCGFENDKSTQDPSNPSCHKEAFG